MHTALLTVHVIAGTAALVLGPLALAAARGSRWPPGVLLAGYEAAVGGVCASALGLAGLAWERLWWLALIAFMTEAAALSGLAVNRFRFKAPRAWRVHLLGGSYLALVTALLVVSWGDPLVWVLPGTIGLPIIFRAAHGRPRTTLAG